MADGEQQPFTLLEKVLGAPAGLIQTAAITLRTAVVTPDEDERDRRHGHGKGCQKPDTHGGLTAVVTVAHGLLTHPVRLGPSDVVHQPLGALGQLHAGGQQGLAPAAYAVTAVAAHVLLRPSHVGQDLGHGFGQVYPLADAVGSGGNSVHGRGGGVGARTAESVGQTTEERGAGLLDDIGHVLLVHLAGHVPVDDHGVAPAAQPFGLALIETGPCVVGHSLKEQQRVLALAHQQRPQRVHTPALERVGEQRREAVGPRDDGVGQPAVAVAASGVAHEDGALGVFHTQYAVDETVHSLAAHVGTAGDVRQPQRRTAVVPHEHDGKGRHGEQHRIAESYFEGYAPETGGLVHGPGINGRWWPRWCAGRRSRGTHRARCPATCRGRGARRRWVWSG